MILANWIFRFRGICNGHIMKMGKRAYSKSVAAPYACKGLALDSHSTVVRLTALKNRKAALHLRVLTFPWKGWIP